MACRLCWDQFEDPESGVATYSYQIFQLSPPDFPSASASALLPASVSSSVPASSGPSSASRKLLQNSPQTPTATPVTPQITLDASIAPRAQLVSGLELQYGYTYYAEITATNNANLNATSTSTNVLVAKDPNHGLLIAIVVLASIGVSMLLVACLTAFIVRRRWAAHKQATYTSIPKCTPESTPNKRLSDNPSCTTSSVLGAQQAFRTTSSVSSSCIHEELHAEQALCRTSTINSVHAKPHAQQAPCMASQEHRKLHAQQTPSLTTSSITPSSLQHKLPA